MVKKIGKILFFGALFGVILYTTVYLLASRGEAFKFVEQKIQSSNEIESDIGKIESVRLSPFGTYEDKSAGADEWATMTVDVSGVKKTIVLDVKVKKKNGVWSIEEATNNGNPVVLN